LSTETNTLIKPQTIRYWSLSDNFQVLRLRANTVFQSGGQKVVSNLPAFENSIIKFSNNQYETTPGAQMFPTGPPDPETGEPTMEDEVTFLERQPSFGVYFHRVDEGAPDAGPVHEQITELSIAGSLEGLVELGRVEQANWRRPEVGHALVRALGAMYRATEDEGRQKEIDDAYNQLLELGVEPPPEEG
jgi:hypothetical protein